MSFRERLVATLRAARPAFEAPGVLVVGSQVPNLREPGAAATLVVSRDVDIGVPVASHAAIKARLGEIRDLRPSAEEPSVWVPAARELLEVNFVGMDPALDPAEVHVLDDDELPLMVFGPLAFVRPGEPAEVSGVRVPLPRSAGLILENSAARGGGARMSEILQRRARRMRSRLARRAWEYCQRHHAAGVWFRLRRLLADASAAYVIPEAEAGRLLAEGHRAESVGAELEPPKLILFVAPERVARIEGAREIPVRLGGELLAARHLALVRFP